MAQIFNTTINRIVDVPDESVGAYLAQSAYRKVKASDPAAPPDTDTVTISRADFEARVQEAVAAALAGTEAENAGKAPAEVTNPEGGTPAT